MSKKLINEGKMREIHDNNIYQILIDCENREITLFTQSERQEQPEFSNVVFTGVLAHHTLHAMQYNILFSIEQVDPREFFKTQYEESELLKKYTLPLSFNDAEGLAQALAKQHLSIYYIGSSYGMSGWVIAEDMQVKPVSGKFFYTRDDRR
jgi:hypothetical protein